VVPAAIFGELFSIGVCAACRPSPWGGGLNLRHLPCRGPRGRHTHFSAKFGKLFLWPARRQLVLGSRGRGRVQKTPRNSGWGVVMEWLNEGLR
jgi:hypothetical protein